MDDLRVPSESQRYRWTPAYAGVTEVGAGVTEVGRGDLAPFPSSRRTPGPTCHPSAWTTSECHPNRNATGGPRRTPGWRGKPAATEVGW